MDPTPFIAGGLTLVALAAVVLFGLFKLTLARQGHELTILQTQKPADTTETAIASLEARVGTLESEVAAARPQLAEIAAVAKLAQRVDVLETSIIKSHGRKRV